jgi:hypothetical protein
MRKLSQKRLEEMAMSSQIELIFCPYIMLNIFCSPDVIDSIRASGRSQAGVKEQNGLFEGYKLVIISTMFLYLDNIVRSPDIIGIPLEPNFYDYWSFTKTPGRDKLKGTMRRGHALSAVIARVHSLMTETLKCNSWDDLTSCLGHIQDFSLCLRRVFIKSCTCLEKIGGRWHKVDSEEALSRRVYDILWTAVMDFKRLHNTYREVYRDFHPIREDIDDELKDSREKTRFHYRHFESLPSGWVPKEWAFGCASTVFESLCRISPTVVRPELNNLREQINQIKDWITFKHFSSATRDILSNAPHFFNPSSRWLFKKSKPVTVRDRRGLMLPVRSISNIEQIKSMLGNTLRIVEIESPAAPLNLACLLDGAVMRAKRTGEKALVMEARHPAGRGRYDYSFAIFMPAYSGEFIPMNASMWWVFYDICNDFSGTASRMFARVKKSLKENEAYTDLLSFKIEKNEFLGICEEPGYKYLKEEIDDLKKLDSEIRAAFPEILLLAYLVTQGCSPVECHVRPKFLKKKELDVVGVKWVDGQPSEIIIFESKGRATVLEDLQKELRYFLDKIELTNANIQQLAEVLGIPYHPDIHLRSIFVSMAELINDEIEKPAEIDLWDFDRMQRKLLGARVPKEYVNLLKKKILYRPFLLNDSFITGFFGRQGDNKGID